MNINKETIKLCKKNNRRAQFELYEASFGSLMSIASRYERNTEDAAALVNIGFLKIIQNLDKYKPEIPFEAWIRRIMINTVIDEYRKNKKRTTHEDVVDFGEQGYMLTTVDYNLIEEEISAEQVEYMLNQLPEIQRRVFNLYEIDGYNHKEIAEMLSMSERSSKRHLAASRQSLKGMASTAIEQLYSMVV